MKPLRSIPSNYFLRNLEIPFEVIREKKAINKKQDLNIYSIFTRYPDRDFSAWELWDMANELGHGYLIGSVRRSVTTLKEAGYIIKTGQKMERENSVNNLWKLKQQSR